MKEGKEICSKPHETYIFVQKRPKLWILYF